MLGQHITLTNAVSQCSMVHRVLFLAQYIKEKPLNIPDSSSLA